MLGNRAAVVDLRAGIMLSSPIGAAALTRGMFMSCSFLKSRIQTLLGSGAGQQGSFEMGRKTPGRLA